MACELWEGRSIFTLKSFIIFLIIMYAFGFIGYTLSFNYNFEKKIDFHCKLSGYYGVYVKQETNFPRFDKFPYFQRDYFCIINSYDAYYSEGAKHIKNIKEIDLK
jgi:hypothetical protein